MLDRYRKLLFEIKDSLYREDYSSLRELSNKSLEQAAFEKDKYLVEISLISYSLQKILSKEHFKEDVRWRRFSKNIFKFLNKAIKGIDSKNVNQFEQGLHRIEKEITAADQKLGNYLKNVYEKAKVKQASRAYAFGLSISLAAELTGANLTDLQDYVGATKIADEEKVFMPLKERVKFLRGL